MGSVGETGHTTKYHWKTAGQVAFLWVPRRVQPHLLHFSPDLLETGYDCFSRVRSFLLLFMSCLPPFNNACNERYNA